MNFSLQQTNRTPISSRSRAISTAALIALTLIAGGCRNARPVQEVTNSSSDSTITNHSGKPTIAEEMIQKTNDANDETAKNRLKMVALGLIQYTQDWDEKFPKMDSIDNVQSVLEPYKTDADSYIDPFSNMPWQFNDKFSGKSGSGDSNIVDSEIIAYSPQPEPDGSRHCLLANGVCKKLSASDWDAAVSRTAIKPDPEKPYDRQYTLTPQPQSEEKP